LAINPEYRRAALIATAVTVPLIVLVLLGVAAVTGSSDDSGGPTKPPAPLSVAAPPHAAAQAAACAKVIAALPVQLGKLDPRVVHTHPDSPYVVAWGDPAVVLACGVDRPKALHPGSSEQVFNAGSVSGPFYLVSRSGDANVYTIIDRAPYVAITVPQKYAAADVLPDLVGAVGTALPHAVCRVETSADPDTLCTRRSD